MRGKKESSSFLVMKDSGGNGKEPLFGVGCWGFSSKFPSFLRVHEREGRYNPTQKQEED